MRQRRSTSSSSSVPPDARKRRSTAVSSPSIPTPTPEEEEKEVLASTETQSIYTEQKYTPSNPLLQTLPAAPSAPDDPRDLSALLSYGPTHLPYTAAWTDSRIEQVRAFKHWVYIAINVIASKIASSLPNVTYVSSELDQAVTSPGDLAGKTYNSYSHLRSKALLPLLSHEQIQPAPSDHPLSRLLLDPNTPDTVYDLFYETILFNRLTGVAYWWTPLNPVTGLPDAIWVLPSHWVWPVYGKPGESHLLGYELRPVEGNYLRRFLPLNEIIEFKHKNPISKIDGYSPMTAASQWIDTLTMVNTARWHAYRNGTFPTVAIQFDGTYLDPSEEDLRRIESKFLARYIGETRSNKPLFLPPGVKATALTLKPNEMIFGETAKETRDNILALYGVPPIIAGIMDGMTTGSLTAAQVGFFCLTINPLLRFMGQVITEKLARLYDPTLRVWWEDMTPDDPSLQEEKIKTDLLAGAITPNEIRLIRGRQPYAAGWGDQPIAPVNMQTLPLGGDSSHLLPNNQETQPHYSDKE